jgi:cyclopropane fatty-acyl-phospholipid synthase-like methyltransferase
VIQTNVEAKINGRFDYILAHSIFTHTGIDILEYWIQRIKRLLKKDGTCIATFYFSNKVAKVKGTEITGWIYPDCVKYKKHEVEAMIDKYNLKCEFPQWKHPSQNWTIIRHG